MLVQKFLGKIEKAMGGNAVESRWYETTLYDFKLEREVSKVTVRGHGWEWDNGDVVVYRLTDDNWARATVYPWDGSNLGMKAVFGSSDGFEDVDVVSGVMDVEEEVVGRTEWDIEVDVAAGKIVSVESYDILDGVGKSERMKEIVD